MKRALITGITGQDGSYLAELLLAKGYEVHGIIRRASTFNTHRIDHIYQEMHTEGQRLFLHYGDLLESKSLVQIIRTAKPDEVYNLGAQSHERVSFDMPVYSADVDYLGTLRLLEAIRTFSDKEVRFYQASSSEMYGGVDDGPLNEDTPFHPRSPYAVAKVASYYQTINYREAYGMFAANGILFNHESPRRGETFVTRKITRGLAMILAGQITHLYMGNLDARRDWGYAADYVEGMWRMLQHDTPDDFVLATGETHSVRSFLQFCCGMVGLDAEAIVRIDPRYFRPSEVDVLLGDASKAERLLGWKPKTTLSQLAALMLHSDCKVMGVDPSRYPALLQALPAQ